MDEWERKFAFVEILAESLLVRVLFFFWRDIKVSNGSFEKGSKRRKEDILVKST